MEKPAMIHHKFFTKLCQTAKLSIIALIAICGFSPLLSAQETISKIEDIHGGVVVILHGTVDEIVDDNEFYLKDSTGRVLIFVGEDNQIKTKLGETLTVFGFSSHQSVHAVTPKITANSILRVDGTEVNFGNPAKSDEPIMRPKRLMPIPKWKILNP